MNMVLKIIIYMHIKILIRGPYALQGVRPEHRDAHGVHDVAVVRHDATEHLGAVHVTGDILDPVAAAPQGALQALVARLHGVVTHFDQ